MLQFSGFPEKGVEDEAILQALKPGSSSRNQGGTFMGYPQTTPHAVAIEAYLSYMEYNTNHVGVFTNSNRQLTASQKMESEVIAMLGDLYGLNEADGYITSGGTEGNILGVWIARNYFSAQKNTVALMQSCLTHESIQKAVDLTMISHVEEIALEDCHFRMDTRRLEEAIDNLISHQIYHAIIIATAGYTLTGTSDDIREINEIVIKFNKQYGFQGWIHIDAAIGGMVLPFREQENTRWFECEHVMSMTVDPHKMGYIPYSAGVFMGRKNVLSWIERNNQFSKTHVSNTLIGSRNGAAAAACWAMFQHLGYSGYKGILDDLISKKEYLLGKLLQKHIAEVISNPETNMCCLSFNSFSNCLLPGRLEQKYATRAFSIQYRGSVINCYKLYIMPHISYATLDMLYEDIMEALAESSLKPSKSEVKPQHEKVISPM